MTLNLGTVFWKDDHHDGHYYVVITPPSYPEVLVVNFTTQGLRKDQSCILQPGCHPVIKEESVISFDHAAVFATADVQRYLDDGVFQEHPGRASDELMLAIWGGAYKTNRMTIRCRELLSQTVPG